MRSLTFAFALLAAAPSLAQDVDPKAVQAIETAEQGWDAAFGLAADADPVAAEVLTWLQLWEGAGEFAEYQAFLAEHPGWPGIGRVRAEGEAVIEKGHDASEVIAYFADTPPQTGQGALRLAEALTTSGQPEQARDALRTAWLNLRLTQEDQTALTDAFGDVLEPFHAARADALLWRARTADAERMIPLLEPDQQALTRARIGYFRRSSNLLALFNAVPTSLREDPGFVHARWTWMARRGKWEDAVEILLDRSTSRAALGEPERWADRRRTLARWAMREGKADEAYTLAARHYLQGGAAYADLEWLAGYIALTYLGDPQTALEHFETAARAVRTPISVGRMQYWIGRAQEVLGDADGAVAAYGLAAEHQTGFYGLLAAEKLGRSLDPALAETVSEWPDTAVFDNELVKAGLLLLEAGERGHARSFLTTVARQLEPSQLTQLGAHLDQMDEQYYTLLMGKAAIAQGVLAPQVYHPVHDLAAMDLPVDPALALAVARRESEFHISIGSPAGALGLMQLMPRTAQEVSGILDLPYTRLQLVTDWEYNATLGGKYLHMLEEEFGPTPVMIAAGYNAGPSRPNGWMDERGDPRLGEMDVIDWIEHIPFRETRNYVMRVTESIPVYQARLSGEAGPIAFTEMLVGEKPIVRPIARPVPEVVSRAPTVRPILRPERG